MPLSAAGNPLHTRSLSVTLSEAAAPEVAFAADVPDLHERGFAPVGGELAVEMPRLFGAGSKPAVKPPPGWQRS